MSRVVKTRKRKAIARTPVGRVDILAERLLETAVEQSRSSFLADVLAATRPGVRNLLRNTVGPRTRRGRQIAENLFAAKDALDRVRASRQERRI